MRPGFLGLFILITFTIAACGSANSSSTAVSTHAATSKSASANQAALRRSAEAQAIVAQCGLDQGLVKASSLPSSLGTDGKIKALVGNTPVFLQWFQNVSSTSIGGKYLYEWATWAATYGKLPTTVCGSASASQLANSLFPGWPSVWNS